MLQQHLEIVADILGVDRATGNAETRLQVAIEKMSLILHDAIADMKMQEEILDQRDGLLRRFPQQGEMGQVRQNAEITEFGRHGPRHFGRVGERTDEEFLVDIAVEDLHGDDDVALFLGVSTDFAHEIDEELLCLAAPFLTRGPCRS